MPCLFRLVCGIVINVMHAIPYGVLRSLLVVFCPSVGRVAEIYIYQLLVL